MRVRSRWLLFTAVGVLVAVVAVSTGWLVAQPSGSANPNRYGGVPSWLPASAVPVGRTVTATPAHPWLAIEGDSVLARLPRGHALVTVVGPVVPEEGEFPVPPTTPCSFTITFAQGTGAVPISASAFTIVDELGQLHHPVVTLAGGGPLPIHVTPGRTLTLTVTDVLPTGSGTLRWSPGGGRALVSWDFDVEID